MINVVLQAEGKLQMEFKRMNENKRMKCTRSGKYMSKYTTFKIMLPGHSAIQLEFDYLNIFLAK